VQYDVRKLYFVEIGSPKDYSGLQRIAAKHNGRYHSRVGEYVSSSFMFGKESDALAFIKETKDWPQQN